MTVHAHAGGKLILVGEHAVVYGHPAVAIPLPSLTVEISVNTAQEPNTLFSEEEWGRVMRAFLLCRQLLARQYPPIPTGGLPPLRIQSSLPLGKGLGGSAAVSIALVRFCAQWFSIDLTVREVASYANQLESIFHHAPSGVDVETALSSAPLFFQKGQPGRTLPALPPCSIVLIDTREHASTEKMVRCLQKHLEETPADHQHLQAIGSLAQDVRQAIEQQDLPRLGASLTQAQGHLRALHLSTPALDRAVATLCDKGALGAKMTGSGGGGIAFGVFSSPPDLSSLQACGDTFLLDRTL
ncbi:MAG: mevalonate kinase [Holosporales bacterium]|jgi:mevalonate kinase|nr:mevalonate kinase [Holosporales bacterium]